MKKKEEIINYLIDRYGFKSYLEIWVRNSYENLVNNRKEWLNLITVKEFTDDLL